MPGGFGHEHGAYLPDEMKWSVVDGGQWNGGHHHRVWLLRARPGQTVPRRILLGEVRRYRLKGRATRYWRAFPEGTLTEFPPVFRNHYSAMAYLKERWEARVLVPEMPQPVRLRHPRSDVKQEEVPQWVKFLGSDPWEDLDVED